MSNVTVIQGNKILKQSIKKKLWLSKSLKTGLNVIGTGHVGIKKKSPFFFNKKKRILIKKKTC